jgi:hypothetical protein
MTRNTFFSSTVIVILAFFATASAMQNGSKFKRYNQKSGTVEYKITGNMLKNEGKEILCFDQNGAIEAKYTTMEMQIAGFTQKTNTATYTEGATIFTVDLNTNTGTKMENSMLKNLEGKDMQDAGKKMLVSMGGKQVGNETFMDRNCEVWVIENLGSKSWIWNGLMMKTEVNMMGQQITYTAVKVSDTVDPAKLKRPDIQYNEGMDPMKMLEQMKKNMPKKN